MSDRPAPFSCPDVGLDPPDTCHGDCSECGDKECRHWWEVHRDEINEEDENHV